MLTKTADQKAVCNERKKILLVTTRKMRTGPLELTWGSGFQTSQNCHDKIP